MDINQNIQSKLAFEVAQLTLDKATLQAQIEQLQEQLNAQQQTENYTEVTDD
ncbi:hypothetical protein AB3329_08025 [Streptococcus sp. H31]|uniref:hypothetical protein n=1 Tax=Streptococcus huangxiaojuni TaxID=3237239 RepID=UPI0034A3F833